MQPDLYFGVLITQRTPTEYPPPYPFAPIVSDEFHERCMYLGVTVWAVCNYWLFSHVVFSFLVRLKAVLHLLLHVFECGLSV